MSKQVREKRNHKRFRFKDVFISVTQPRHPLLARFLKPKFARCRVYDLGEGGMQMSLPWKIDAGSNFGGELKFEMLDWPGMVVTAEVRYVIPIKVSGKAVYNLGCQFTEIDRETKHKINRLCDSKMSLFYAA